MTEALAARLKELRMVPILTKYCDEPVWIDRHDDMVQYRHMHEADGQLRQSTLVIADFRLREMGEEEMDWNFQRLIRQVHEHEDRL